MSDEETRAMARDAVRDGSPEATLAWLHAAMRDAPPNHAVDDPRLAAYVLAAACRERWAPPVLGQDVDGGIVRVVAESAMDEEAAEPYRRSGRWDRIELLASPAWRSAWAVRRVKVRLPTHDVARVECAFAVADERILTIGVRLLEVGWDDKVQARGRRTRQMHWQVTPSSAWPVIGGWKNRRSGMASRGEVYRVGAWLRTEPGLARVARAAAPEALSMLDSASRLLQEARAFGDAPGR